MCSDTFAMFISLLSSYYSTKDKTLIYPFGFNRLELITGFINGISLLKVVFEIVIESLERIHKPQHVYANRIIVVSILGLLVNLIGLVFFSDFLYEGSNGGVVCNHCHIKIKPESVRCESVTCSVKEELLHENIENLKLRIGIDKVNELQTGFMKNENADHIMQLDGNQTEDHNDNMRGVVLHLVADTLGSLTVIFANTLIYYWGYNMADPICSVFCACLIFVSAWPLVSKTGKILLLALTDEDSKLVSKIHSIIMKIDNIQVANVYVWKPNSNKYKMTINIQ